MECKNCKWIELSKFVFPDGSNSIICNKYRKHLGFTDKNGEEALKGIDDEELEEASKVYEELLNENLQ